MSTRFNEMWENSLLAEEILASQEEGCSFELGN
jgi:hypothetical protein